MHIQRGNLVERRLNQRKWKWVVHGSPKDHKLTSITPVLLDELNEKSYSLFLTSEVGFVFEYRVPKHTGISLFLYFLSSSSSFERVPSCQSEEKLDYMTQLIMDERGNTRSVGRGRMRKWDGFKNRIEHISQLWNPCDQNF